MNDTAATGPFTVRVTVRSYEIDAQGHLNSAVYHQYGDHARWACMSAAGVPADELRSTGVGPVTLETTIRYHRELRAGDEVDVTCTFEWGEGKTFGITQELRRADGVLAAQIRSLGGLLDLERRRLVPDPAGRLRGLSGRPALIGL